MEVIAPVVPLPTLEPSTYTVTVEVDAFQENVTILKVPVPKLTLIYLELTLVPSLDTPILNSKSPPS